MPSSPATSSERLRALALGAGAGLASAALFYSAVRGSVALSLALLLITPLPSLIAGFGWGLTAAIAAALTSMAVMALAVAPTFAVGYLLALGIPVAGITHLAFLARYNDDGTLADWYSTGRMLLALALYGAALPVLIIALSGGSYRILEPDLMRFLKQMSASAPIGSSFRTMGEPQMRAFVDLWIEVLPGALATYWTFFFAVNVYLAARITRMSGRLVRPWPDLHWLSLPPIAAAVVLAALIGVAVGGSLRVIGIGALGAFLVAYLLQGLSVVHAIGRAKAPWLLYVTYATIALAGAITVPLTALTGLLENLVRIRARVVHMPAALPPGSY
jgi:hypothetical protein